MAAHRGLIDKAQCLIPRPGVQPLVPRRQAGGVLVWGSPQGAMPPPAPVKAQRLQELPDPFPAVLHPQAGGEKVPHQRGRPQAHVVARSTPLRAVP
jgi:hypothetical protein